MYAFKYYNIAYKDTVNRNLIFYYSVIYCVLV